MVPYLLSVRHEASLLQAVELMAFEGVQVLGVVNAQRQLAGVVGALDVLRWLGKSDH